MVSGRRPGGGLGENWALARAGQDLSRGRLLIKLLTVLAAATAVIVAITFVLFVSTLEQSETDPTNRADAIVVLTGGADRIEDAIQLLAEGRASRLLISGVNEVLEPGSLARRLPMHADLFACCIDLDYGARNTVGNAVETRRWARQHRIESIILVTSNYHMPRALLEFRRAMPRASIVARPVVPYGFEAGRWWHDLAVARVLFGEFLKYVAASGRALALPVIEEKFDSRGIVRSLADD